MDAFTREFALHLAAEDARREVAAGFAKLRHRLWLIDLRFFPNLAPGTNENSPATFRQRGK
jgi:hypothetical protein